MSRRPACEPGRCANERDMRPASTSRALVGIWPAAAAGHPRFDASKRRHPLPAPWAWHENCVLQEASPQGDAVQECGDSSQTSRDLPLHLPCTTCAHHRHTHTQKRPIVHIHRRTAKKIDANRFASLRIVICSLQATTPEDWCERASQCRANWTQTCPCKHDGFGLRTKYLCREPWVRKLMSHLCFSSSFAPQKGVLEEFPRLQ